MFKYALDLHSLLIIKQSPMSKYILDLHSLLAIKGKTKDEGRTGNNYLCWSIVSFTLCYKNYVRLSFNSFSFNETMGDIVSLF